MPNPADFTDVLKKYAVEKIIFVSTNRGAPYSINELDARRFEVVRLGANAPEKISEELYIKKLVTIQVPHSPLSRSHQ